MKVVVDKNTGQVLYGTLVEVELLENEVLIDDLPNSEFTNPYYNFKTQTFYDNI
jgi:hypothetical protein